MQNALFDDDAARPDAAEVREVPAAPAARPPKAGVRGANVVPTAPDPAHAALAEKLPDTLWLGTSSWTYPGWDGIVWNGAYAESVLSRRGLGAYASHPLLQSVCLDRTFYRPLSASQYAGFAAQVPDGFRFVVKAPSLVTDAMVRGEAGKGLQPNPAFLDPVLAVREFIQPVLEGLGHTAGALVFQLSPLPLNMLGRMPEVLERLRAMLRALPSLLPAAPDGVVAVEVRDPAFLTPAFAAVLRETGATFCLGLHAKMPPIEDQLPLLRALWPGPLVCRWNFNRKHGAYGYEDAEKRYAPFASMIDPDPATREALAKVVAATTRAGYRAYVTISNKAEGSAPLSVMALAEEIHQVLHRPAAAPGPAR